MKGERIGIKRIEKKRQEIEDSEESLSESDLAPSKKQKVQNKVVRKGILKVRTGGYDSSDDENTNDTDDVEKDIMEHSFEESDVDEYENEDENDENDEKDEKDEKSERFEEEIEPSEDGKEKSKNEILAETMSRILAKQVGKEKVILAKDKSAEKRIEEEKLEEKAKRALTNEKRKKIEKAHISKIDPSSLSYEKNLRKIATKGVVKLFNAIKKQKEEMSLTGSITEVKKDKVLEMSKDNFLNMLKSSGSNEKKEQKWDVLSDNYMMGVKMKDWKNQDEDNEMEEEIEQEEEDEEEEEVEAEEE